VSTSGRASRHLVALITGGGRGIGRAIAEAFARAGLDLALTGRSVARLETAADEVRRLGVQAIARPLDVTDFAAIPRMVDAISAEIGPIDVLVNNAGIAESAPFTRTGLEQWERHLAINATGAFALAQAVVPGMLARGWGRVINVASLAGLSGAAYVTAYVASKHALVGFTRALAAEVAGKGVTANALCPGYVATDMVWHSARNIAARTGRSYDDAVEFLARSNPGGRLVRPEEVAAVAVKLLDDDTTNGEAIVIDGSGAA
jgi:NAD(P)-dependent dehydrogenase (short-subunit alcohol dehydrogenase family)